MTGTHGKSTTTALLGHLLVAAGLDPTVEVGAFIGAWGASVRAGGGAPFLVEADEFGDNFLNYHPAGAIVTNVEMDHPDYFADAAAVMDSFERFVRGMGAHPALDGRLLLVRGRRSGRDGAASPPRWLGRARRALRARAARSSRTDVRRDRRRTRVPPLRPRVGDEPGRGAQRPQRHGRPDRWRERSAPTSTLLADGLRTFAGAGRRMELIADTAAVTIYDDYGHHPTEVRAALAAARQKVGPDRRLWAVFEPHMYSRTALLMDEFATAFTDADEVVIADIFASRDTPEAMASTSAEALADAIERTSARARHRDRRRRRHDRLRGRSPRHRRRGARHGRREVVSHRARPGGAAGVIGARSAVLGALLAVAVAIAYQGVVSLVEASGASDQPAVILILLLSAFLGVLTAVATRMLRLPGATAPTVLVLGWTLVPVILAAIPSAATQLFGGDAALSSGQALALATATVAAAVTLGVPADRR